MGTPRLASDANQQIVWRWKWDAFGYRPVKASNTLIEMNLRYPGQYYDTETGLFYNWNRYYDPSTGRYGRSDPIGLMKGENSLYVYVNSNPFAGIDARGLKGKFPLKSPTVGFPTPDTCRLPGESCATRGQRGILECMKKRGLLTGGSTCRLPWTNWAERCFEQPVPTCSPKPKVKCPNSIN
jgi:RHS repeat-associated protein